jgi:hypothetical protein
MILRRNFRRLHLPKAHVHKVLSFLFEQATKVAPAPEPEPAPEVEAPAE